MTKHTLRILGGFILPQIVWLSVCQSGFADNDLKCFRRDLTGSGFKNALACYDEHKMLVKVMVDDHLSGKYTTTVYYKNGYRDRAEKDTDGDGRVDTWIKYYFTGQPWVIARDTNGDGKPDYWRHYKNGFLYKKERDRNYDGRVDLIISYEGKVDMQYTGDLPKEYERKEDNDFDGVFEKTERRKLRVSDTTVDAAAGSIEEVNG